jgi:hypothetical protein
MIDHDTPMLLMPPPFEQELPYPGAPPNVLLTMYAGRPSY